MLLPLSLKCKCQSFKSHGILADVNQKAHKVLVETNTTVNLTLCQLFDLRLPKCQFLDESLSFESCPSTITVSIIAIPHVQCSTIFLLVVLWSSYWSQTLKKCQMPKCQNIINLQKDLERFCCFNFISCPHSDVIVKMFIPKLKTEIHHSLIQQNLYLSF